MKHLIFIIIIAITSIILFYLLFWYFPTKIQSMAMNRFYEWKEIYGEDKAREMTVEWLKKRLLVKDVGIDGYSIWIEYWTTFPRVLLTELSQEELKEKLKKKEK